MVHDEITARVPYQQWRSLSLVFSLRASSAARLPLRLEPRSAPSKRFRFVLLDPRALLRGQPAAASTTASYRAQRRPRGIALRPH